MPASYAAPAAGPCTFHSSHSHAHLGYPLWNEASYFCAASGSDSEDDQVSLEKTPIVKKSSKKRAVESGSSGDETDRTPQI